MKEDESRGERQESRRGFGIFRQKKTRRKDDEKSMKGEERIESADARVNAVRAIHC